MLTTSELLESELSYMEIAIDLNAINGLDITIFEQGLEKVVFPLDFWPYWPDFSTAMPGT